MKMPTGMWRKVVKLMPALAADGVLIERGEVLLIKRAREPFKGMWALPGGFVDYGETLRKAAEREFLEETGVRARATSMAGVYDNPRRDPRGNIISVVFLMKRISGKIKTSSEAKEIKFFPAASIPGRMAYDSRDMVRDALRIYNKRKRKRQAKSRRK